VGCCRACTGPTQSRGVSPRAGASPYVVSAYET